MTDWPRILSLCMEALTQDLSHREAFLDKACAGDPELRRTVLSLLNLANDTDSVLDTVLQSLKRLLDDAGGGVSSDDADQESDPADACPDEFKSSPLASLRPGTLATLLSSMETRQYAPGDFLMKQGESADYLLLLLEGCADVRLRDAPDGRAPIGELRAGDIVGEISLVAQEARTADVLARSQVEALLLSSSDFWSLTQQDPELLVVLTNVVAERLGQARHDGLGGKNIHGYRIEQCVGRGGMGVVYEATRLDTGARVALKMMNHRLIYEPHALKRFRREATILGTLRHPSLAQLYDRFSAYKTEFLAMEFCSGQSVQELIAAHGPWPEAAVRCLVGQLAEALAYVHERGVIHRDVKPSNIMVSSSGAIKLLDFGIVTLERSSTLPQDIAHDTSSQLVRLLGTPRYMAPEQFSGKPLDHRADLYGLTCVAYEALCGRPVVAATDLFGVVREQALFTLPPRDTIGEGISEEMHSFLLLGLEQDPGKRTLDLASLSAWSGPILLDA